jgi:hypothetical protein
MKMQVRLALLGLIAALAAGWFFLRQHNDDLAAHAATPSNAEHTS